MEISEIQGVLQFLRTAEGLKETIRSSHTSSGRPESVAEHTWRLTLTIVLFRSEFPDIDFARLIRMVIIHDLGEVVGGDIPATDQTDSDSKSARERIDFESILKPLPDRLQSELLDLWDEYEAAVTPEARLAKAFDKIETIIQHNQGLNPADFDYGFNLDYGRRYMDVHPLIAAIRVMLDEETTQRKFGSQAAAACEPNRKLPDDPA